MSGPVKDRASVKTIHDDAKGQYARGLKRSNNNGVASAKPRVITGSDDATAHKAPPERNQSAKNGTSTMMSAT